MNTFRSIEDDHGTITGTRHQHRGYYAGDFTSDAVGATGRPGSFTVLRTVAHPTELRAA
jgi:hypothetical protein